MVSEKALFIIKVSNMKFRKIQETVDMVTANLQKDRIKRLIVQDLFNTAENGGFTGFYKLDGDDLMVEGEIFDFFVSYEITNRPTYTVTHFSYYDYQPDEEVELSDLEFEITKIDVCKKESGNGEICDALDLITPEQYEKLKSYFEFDVRYEIAERIY